ncbi:radical SAM family heme chaperone HemW [Wenyingzhuangia marina]|uniref:Heme chaperone HemW n=1 Tax=Wenyingzhuangia marina TaxID=1195760 RepID=A0A1M5WRT1_9FLAO|nr:radical SAM family heme chaperone HemW [Wenyingzhuangia marina]GGF80051.1 coproporphyrinogen III oxidase [Wenyingzhuangia marina]SHH89814.1 oxygen-independent coproporphyrinogen-3 oxidase [Wenyingzhuangia marina]
MSGIYLHIPFCKKACHYCDFHFSTSLKNKEPLLKALVQEIILRADEFKNKTVKTIYFGGGTPSILDVDEIKNIIKTIRQYYKVIEIPEITLEANPDDLTDDKIKELAQTEINRLSIGVQSFGDKELQMMNRAHSSEEVKQCLHTATQYFNNITIDLMYGIPGLSNEEWKQNIQQALKFGISHISSYALTVEEGTALADFIKKGTYPVINESLAAQHFDILVNTLTQAGFDHYEISNFGKPNFYSKHNTSYWLGKWYLGFGPSAHSFNGNIRSWNVANNAKYIKSLLENSLPSGQEILTVKDQYNEYIMTGLRTIWGVSLEKVSQDFGIKTSIFLEKQIQPFLENGTLMLKQNQLKTTQKGKFLADGIASELFWV